ncbi:MAG: hypothetical protein JWQ02_140 [Capsulimonas sp.]|jgi:hypothetical protein|nr:hypothetical protein [Capsulimonas sp.]
MKTAIALAVLAISLTPLSANAAKPMAHATAMPTTYVCSKCHMKYDAATAKKDHFKDPMDGGKLVPVVVSKKAVPAKPMGGMKM